MTPQGPPPGRMPSRRRQIQRAIWRRTDPPAGMEELARAVALRQAGLRWVSLLYAIGFVIEVVLLFTEHSAGGRIRDGVLALLFLALAAYQYEMTARAYQAVERWSPDTPR